ENLDSDVLMMQPAEAPRLKRKNISATIAADVKRFCHQIKKGQGFWYAQAINSFLAGMQAGFGPFVAVLLADEKWTQEHIGYVLSVGGLAGLLSGRHRPGRDSCGAGIPEDMCSGAMRRWGLTARRGRANPAIVPPIRCSYTATRLSDNVRLRYRMTLANGSRSQSVSCDAASTLSAGWAPHRASSVCTFSASSSRPIQRSLRISPTNSFACCRSDTSGRLCRSRDLSMGVLANLL